MSEGLDALVTDLRDLGFEKPNCYKCKYRQEIPWSAHSKCDSVSPEVGFGVLAGNVRIKSLELNPVGVKGGWANWPLDFDPVWVNHCPFFEQKIKNI